MIRDVEKGLFKNMDEVKNHIGFLKTYHVIAYKKIARKYWKSNTLTGVEINEGKWL